MGSTMIFAAVIAFVFVTLGIRQSEGVRINELKEPILEKSEEEAFEKLLKMEEEGKAAIESLIKQFLPTVLKMSSEFELSGQCMGSMLKVISGLRDMKMWAFEMVDSTGIPVGGMLAGKVAAFGSYQQCLRVEVPQESYDKKIPVTGQYCLLDIRPPLPPRTEKLEVFKSVFHRINATFKTELMNNANQNFLFGLYVAGLRVGICVPSACSKNEINEMVKLGGAKIGLNIDIDSCEVKEGWKVNTIQITVMTILSCFVLVCLLSTIIVEFKARKHGSVVYDLEKKSYPYRMLMSFSMVANFKNLMRTRPSGTRSLDCLNGIRYLSCTWVILGHAYSLYDFHMFRELIEIKKVLKDPFFSVISNGFLSVDSFMFITSTLLSYSIVKFYDSTKTYSPIITILRRLFRLLPGMVLIMGIVFLLPLISSGPDYRELYEGQIQNCERYWWTNLLFISNIVPGKINEMCMGHFWYLSVDMQLFIVGIVYFLLLFKKGIYGKIFLVICLAVSAIANGTLTYAMNFPPAVLTRYVDVQFLVRFTSYMYVLPQAHLGVYTVGLFLGTYLSRNPKIKLSEWSSYVGWTTASCSGLIVLYAIYPWNKTGNYTMVEAIIYSATSKTSWALCLAWLVLACFAEKGGYVNDILCWPGFQPLVKISYMVYLIHVPLIMVFQFTKQGPRDYSHTDNVFNFFGLICTSHISAAIIRIFFEAPIIELERLFWKKILSEEENGCEKDCVEKPKLQMVLSDHPIEIKLDNGVEKTSNENGNDSHL